MVHRSESHFAHVRSVPSLTPFPYQRSRKRKMKIAQFKKGDIFFNYGCFPQTWEDPTFVHPDAEGCRGDNDPLDVCEIGARIIRPGVRFLFFLILGGLWRQIHVMLQNFRPRSLTLSVPCFLPRCVSFRQDIRPVKVLGVLCMIDEGECDWKVVVIDAEDKWAPYMNDVDDVERELPGMLDAIREWYRTYKIPDGKPPNVFGLGERFMDKEYALRVIDECHHAWEQLVSGEKERHLDDSHGPEVKDLVRSLSKNSLFALAQNLDEHMETRDEEFGTEDSGAMFF
eukprot:Pompholyxophrys_punicea_v1_NODE_334_length_2224_cov_2.285846.p1 type:complete len:284 gc:universal NODE_334_length_2224_cov_2.285846:1614-763(-)